jgi:N-formylglutamate amidohydrolase
MLADGRDGARHARYDRGMELAAYLKHEALDCRLPVRQTVPVVVASPHSGSAYPARFLAQAAVGVKVLRRAEDAFVDELFAAAPELGAPLLAARFPRSYVDANREPYELDPGMFEGPLPRPLNHRTTRVAAGLGMIPRVAASGEAIYRNRVPSDEIERRLASCWRPYHAALSALVEQTCRQFGAVLLVDAHSMPSSASQVGGREREHRVDVVLGDNHGDACAAELVGRAEQWLSSRGLRVERNQPYAGGFTTQRYGRPASGHHALQVEINRALYMDETRHERLPSAERVGALMTGLLEALADEALSVLVPHRLAAE